MTQEEMFRSFMEDPILFEKNYLTKQKADTIKLHMKSDVSIVEIIKIVIDEVDRDQSPHAISRKINKYFNKEI